MHAQWTLGARIVSKIIEMEEWLKSIRRSMVYKYGFEVAQSHVHMMQLDAKNGNNKWKEAVNTKLSQRKKEQSTNRFTELYTCHWQSCERKTVITLTDRNW